MSNTANLPITDADRKLFKVDIRSVIIVAILAFGAGAVSGDQQSSAGTPSAQPAPATVQASSGK